MSQIAGLVVTAEDSQHQFPPSASETLRPLLPYHFAKRHQVVASSLSPTEIEFSTVDTPSIFLLSELQRVFPGCVSWRQVSSAEFIQLFATHYETGTGKANEAAEHLEGFVDCARLEDLIPESEDLLAQQDEAPVIRLINALLWEAIREQASDVHIETYERLVVVRFRVDGVLRKVLEPNRAVAQLLASRIKVMAKLDIAEKRVPQDGRISIRIGSRDVDIRVSTIPTRFGERIVMRLLDKQSVVLDLARLGMSPRHEEAFKTALAEPHGIILVTGPTGSGKSTTLYAGLSHLNDGSRNILTVEDPVEYDIEGIGQTAVNNKAGMTFARGLRAILRQDPDVVMVGEIRDTETADIAVQASLTGHLVISTLHTNSAIGAVSRLLDMGVEPFLLASSLRMMVAQRLVRRLCTNCRVARPARADELRLLRRDPGEVLILYDEQGCPECFGSGFKGRTAIHEVVVMDGVLRRLVHDRAPESALITHVRQDWPDIQADGFMRVEQGITTLTEVQRVTSAQ